MIGIRTNLKRINNMRKRFKGIIDSFGTKNGWKYPLPTILLTNITDLSTNQIVTDHLWFNLTKGFKDLNLKEGDIVMFDARVKPYYRGYKGYREEVQWEHPIEQDYKLSHPTKISKGNEDKFKTMEWAEGHCGG